VISLDLLLRPIAVPNLSLIIVAKIPGQSLVFYVGATDVQTIRNNHNS